MNTNTPSLCLSLMMCTCLLLSVRGFLLIKCDFLNLLSELQRYSCSCNIVTHQQEDYDLFHVLTYSILLFYYQRRRFFMIILGVIVLSRCIVMLYDNITHPYRQMGKSIMSKNDFLHYILSALHV